MLHRTSRFTASLLARNIVSHSSFFPLTSAKSLQIQLAFRFAKKRPEFNANVAIKEYEVAVQELRENANFLCEKADDLEFYSKNIEICIYGTS